MRKVSEFSRGDESVGEKHSKSLWSVHVGKGKIGRLNGLKQDL